jgi:hypothetical protein
VEQFSTSVRDLSGRKLIASVPARKIVMRQLEEKWKDPEPSSACEKEEKSRRDISGCKKPKKYPRERHKYGNM